MLHMLPDTVKDVPCPAFVEPVLENFRETSVDLRRLQLFQFGCPDAEFDFDYTPPLDRPYKDCDGGADVKEEAHGASLMGEYPGDKSLSSSLGASSSSDSSWLAGRHESFNDTSHFGSSSSDKQELSTCDQDVVIATEETNTMEEDIRPTTPELSYPLATSGQSAQVPSVRHLLLSQTQRLKTYHKQGPVGWTYREVLETIAFPPSEAPHLWGSNISKLASQIGMPVGSTGRDIVMFIVHVASAKNELARVSELIRSITYTAKAIERQALVARMVASTFPNEALAGSLEGNVSPDVETESSRARKRGHDEISTGVSDSEPGDSDHEELESSSSPSGTSSSSTDDSTREIYSRPSRRPKCPRYSEEDLYCRIDDCLWAFDDPRICMKHRQRHFLVQWHCPGPCTKTEEGKFARDETLKRHLLFSRYEACKRVVLELLNLDSIPVSGSLWLAPLRDGPDKPWESPSFQLTDLKTVKERKMNALDSTKAPSPAEDTRRRRYK